MNNSTNWQSVVTKILNDNGIYQLDTYQKQLNQYCNIWTEYLSKFKGISSSFGSDGKICIIKSDKNEKGIELNIKPFYTIENNNIKLVLSWDLYDWRKKGAATIDKGIENYDNLTEIFNEDFILNKLSEMFSIQYPNIVV
jgi:hypothetical protein